MLMDYLHFHQDAVLRYKASDMILQFEADSAYLVLPRPVPVQQLGIS